jgi:hypothetical protein
MSIVEITVFHLVPDADEGSFLAADRRVQAELVPFAPGFIRRTAAREGVAWLVLTLWGTEPRRRDRRHRAVPGPSHRG